VIVLGILAAAVALYNPATEFIVGSSDHQSAISTRGSRWTGAVNSASPASFDLSFPDQPRALPALQFTDAEGRTLSLGDFRGQPIVLNMWATWCIPCRREMPALDRLQAAFGKSELLIVPLSIGRAGAPVIKQFYHQLGIKALGIYLDQSGKASGKLHAVGLPTTLLIDRDGREVARKIGPVEWDSPEIVAALGQRFGLSTSAKKASQ
jgi:thiol-disulfide isomerase/thioredoxin